MQENESSASFRPEMANCALDPAQTVWSSQLGLKGGTFFPGHLWRPSQMCISFKEVLWRYLNRYSCSCCFNLYFVTHSHSCEMSSHISHKAKLRNLNMQTKRMANHFDTVAKKTEDTDKMTYYATTYNWLLSNCSQLQWISHQPLTAWFWSYNAPTPTVMWLHLGAQQLTGLHGCLQCPIVTWQQFMFLPKLAHSKQWVCLRTT